MSTKGQGRAGLHSHNLQAPADQSTAPSPHSASFWKETKGQQDIVRDIHSLLQYLDSLTIRDILPWLVKNRQNQVITISPDCVITSLRSGAHLLRIFVSVSACSMVPTQTLATGCLFLLDVIPKKGILTSAFTPLLKKKNLVL